MTSTLQIQEEPSILKHSSLEPTQAKHGAVRRHLILLVALWAIIYAAALFAPPLLDDADATHANAARNVLLTHDFVTLRVDGIRYLEKAPLPYWFVAAAFRVFRYQCLCRNICRRPLAYYCWPCWPTAGRGVHGTSGPPCTRA